VAQLFRHLQAAGLVEGIKGPGGGYQLTRDPAEITAADVIQAVEGPVALVHCLLPCPDEGPSCSRINRCAAHLLWKRLSETVIETLDSTTLQDLSVQADLLAQSV
jgi:Rrf2 family protein